MFAATDGMEEIVQEFLAESAEALDLLDRDMVELERDPASRERLAGIFRAVHTIKGCSGMLGYSTLERIAHAGESLLGGLRDGKLALSRALMEGLLAMVDAMRVLLGAIEATGSEGDDDHSILVRSLEDLVWGASASVPAPGLSPEVKNDTPNQDLQNKKSIGTSKVHVDAALLDRMMDLAGELVLARNQVLCLLTAQSDRALLQPAQRLRRLTTDIQEAVMKARVLPIGSAWSRFPRLARDLALSCGKQVLVDMEGSDVELDRAMVEAVKDPLTHVLRNAIDHGIETPEQRTAAGKRTTGRLRFRAFYQEGRVHIEISDDGAGVNLARVRERALERGLIRAEDAKRMSQQQLVALLFTPGFSTVGKVTTVSGRGVGLDVVRTNIESIGGTVDLRSEPGQGTTVHIKIPLTLAIVPALIVSAAGQRFAIPQVNLAGVVHLGAGSGPEPVEVLVSAPVYRLRDRLLPLCVLRRELQLGGGTSPGGSYIVVTWAGAGQVGLVVDAVHDTEEIVIKPLNQHLRVIPCFAGAAVLGDGQIALVLDVMGLTRRTGMLSTSQAPSRQSEQNVVETSDEAQRWVVCRGPSGSRFALPLSAVTRLEEISAERIEQSAGQEVVQFGGENIPVLRATSLFNEPAQDSELLQMAVVHEGGLSAGIVVHRVEDILEQTVELRGGAADDLLGGSTVIQGRVTDVLNMRSVVAHAYKRSKPEAADRTT